MNRAHSKTGMHPVMFFVAFLAAMVAIGSAGPANAGFRFKKIVDSFTLIPNGGGASFAPSGVPATSGDWVAFDTVDETIWRATTTGGRLRKLITQDTKIPGGWGKFHQLYASYAQISGDTLVLVADICNCGAGVGIFTRSVFGGPITKLVDKNDTSDAFPAGDNHFGGFPPDFRIGDGLVVFQNRQQVFAVPIGGGTVTPVAGPQDSGYSPPDGYCCIFADPSVKAGKVLLSAGNINAHVSVQSVDSSGDPLSFAYVAIGGTHAPKTPAGYGFNDFGFWGPVIDETMVFAAISTASGMPNITGIYSSGSGGLVRLADTRQAVPQGAGNFDFSWYGTRSPIVASNGIVVFGARDVSTNKVGLYAVRQTGGRVKKIIAEGDPIGSSMVMSLGIGRAALSGTTLVFNVGYTFPGGTGFYSTQIILP